MATETIPDRKLFPSRKELESWKLVDDARQLFWGLREAFNSFPEFATQAALATFWGKNEVEFQIGSHRFSIRHDSKKPIDPKDYSVQFSEGLRVTHNEEIVKDGKQARKWEDIWILKVDRRSSGGGDYSQLNISYHSHITVQDGTRFGTDVERIGDTRSEAAIQHIKDFTERVKALQNSPKTT